MRKHKAKTFKDVATLHNGGPTNRNSLDAQRYWVQKVRKYVIKD